MNGVIWYLAVAAGWSIPVLVLLADHWLIRTGQQTVTDWLRGHPWQFAVPVGLVIVGLLYLAWHVWAPLLMRPLE